MSKAYSCPKTKKKNNLSKELTVISSHCMKTSEKNKKTPKFNIINHKLQMLAQTSLQSKEDPKDKIKLIKSSSNVKSPAPFYNSKIEVALYHGQTSNSRKNKNKNYPIQSSYKK